ncbi:metallophosphoesterase family protein [Thermodesulfobacteriota bacterium]
MIERLSWLHISDLHLKAELDNWGQSVVLRELIKDVSSRIQDHEIKPQFIIVSGDLAYSGADREYLLVKEFLNELLGVLSISKNRLFCVPGNHDVDRSVQKTCYMGAMQILSSPQAVEEFLGDKSERDTLLKRQQAYQEFEKDYFDSIERHLTSDGLCYIVEFDIDNLKICVIGLNSAWLCQGGDNDERKILIGDRQIIDAIEILKKCTPHFVIGVVHHPIDWLQRFDQTTFENRLLSECNFLHRGHLHEPEVKTVLTVSGRRCSIIAAGAAFTSRDFINSYSLVSVDLGKALSEVQSFQYMPKVGIFQSMEPQKIGIRLHGILPGTFAEFVSVISDVVPSAKKIAHYLAAILYGKTNDIPIPFNGRVVFASPSILEDQKENQLKEVTDDFLSLKNLLLAFPANFKLRKRVQLCKRKLSTYAEYLNRLAENDHEFSINLIDRDDNFRKLASTSPSGSYKHTRLLMRRLLEDRDWPVLEQIARRNTSISDHETSTEAKRMLIMCLANADEPSKQNEAAELVLTLSKAPQRSADDVLMAVTIYKNLRKYGEAKTLLLDGLKQFKADSAELLDAGKKLVIETGDSDLRKVIQDISLKQEEIK